MTDPLYISVIRYHFSRWHLTYSCGLGPLLSDEPMLAWTLLATNVLDRTGLLGGCVFLENTQSRVLELTPKLQD